MIAVLKPGTSVRQRDNLILWFKSQGLDVHISEGQTHTVLGIIGDTSRVDIDLLQSLTLSILPSGLARPISWPIANSTRRTRWCR